MQICQRGVTISAPAAANTYTLDRWIASTGTGAAATVSRVVTGDTTNLPNIQYCAQVQRNAGQTGTVVWFVQPFETINSIPFVGKQVTFSFYARKGADYSASSSTLVVNLYSGTGTDQNWVQGYTGQVTVASTTATLTAYWQRFQATGPVGATATELAIQFAMIGVGAALTNDYFQVTGVQIDVGPVALPFRTNAGTLQGELAACQRYLPAVTGIGTEGYVGYAYGTNGVVYAIPFPTQARVTPNGITLSSGLTASGFGLNVAYSITPVFNGATLNSGTVYAGSGVTVTAGQGSRMMLNGTILFTGCEL
jgi:hypothetical protein